MALQRTDIGDDVGDLLRVDAFNTGHGPKPPVVDWITIEGIPERAHDYVIGSRSAIAWVMDAHRVRVDKASGIVNDPNDWCDEVGDPRYILDLVGRVVTVSMRTLEIGDGLPPLKGITA